MAYSHRVIVGGLPRSGSTLLRFLLGSLPGVISCPETAFFTRPLSQIQPRADKVASRIAAKLDLDEAPVRACIENGTSAIQAFDALMDLYGRQVGEKPSGWIEKTPWNCLSYPWLAKQPEDLRFVSTVRDGRDVVTSTLKEEKGYHCTVQRFVDVSEMIMGFDDPRHLIVKYEDLVRKPDEVLETICAHTGIGFDGAALGRWRDPHPTKSLEKVTQPKLAGDISTEWIGSWQAPEHKTRIEEFEAHPRTAGLQAAFGYTQ